MPNSPTTVSEVVANVVSGLAFQGVVPELLDLSERLTQLHALNQSLDQVVAVNTKAVQSAGSGGAGKGPVANIADAVRGSFGGSLGVSPILQGLSRLFGGGGDSRESAISPRYSLPSRLDVVAGQAAAQAETFALEYGQGQVARPVSTVSHPLTGTVSASHRQAATVPSA